MYTASKDDAISTVKNTGQNFREAANEAKSDIVSIAGKAGRKVQDIIHTASDEVVHARDAVTSQIRTNPVQSSLIALGVGVVLGALLRR